MLGGALPAPWDSLEARFEQVRLPPPPAAAPASHPPPAPSRPCVGASAGAVRAPARRPRGPFRLAPSSRCLRGRGALPATRGMIL